MSQVILPSYSVKYRSRESWIFYFFTTLQFSNNLVYYGMKVVSICVHITLSHRIIIIMHTYLKALKKSIAFRYIFAFMIR